ncbi:Zinicin-like metallopeptidase [Actinomadura madurae]|uniref:Zinicin-like metallopeptidase n=1 Tax=Actinomadura madurae TaxID=1993 RepID=A0A1I5C8J1_9ACTN|nr:Zinicin-like metallopeptidase [Actinomadura madurae]
MDDEVRRLGARWGRELARVEFTVEEVPTVEPWFDGPVPLGKTVAPPPSARDRAVRIVVFRRPVEARANGEAELTHLIRDLLVEEVADLLGLSPESVDPSYDGPDD